MSSPDRTPHLAGVGLLSLLTGDRPDDSEAITGAFRIEANTGRALPIHDDHAQGLLKLMIGGPHLA
jgi:hypothetical protein